MTNIQFSLIAPSIRPQLWKQFYESVKNTEINFEIIFVGPKAPVEELPSNVRWINSNVKPSQCTHIGFLEAKGEIVSLTADDARYFSPNGKSSLDNMYAFIKNFPASKYVNPRTLAYGFRMFEDGYVSETSHMHYINFVSTNQSTPLIYPFFAIYRELYEMIGGYDNRFITGQAENDFLLRIAYQKGNTSSSLCPNAMVWADHNDHTNSGKFREYHAKDSLTLKHLWTNKDGLLHIRTIIEEVRKYVNDETLYIKSQGNTGEWI